MANPTTCGIGIDYEPCIVEATATPASITLDPNKQYMIQHNGIDTAGATVTDEIMMATDDSTAALTAGTGQFILLTGNPLVVGPGNTTLTFDDSGSSSPTFSLIPLRTDCGRH